MTRFKEGRSRKCLLARLDARPPYKAFFLRAAVLVLLVAASSFADTARSLAQIPGARESDSLRVAAALIRDTLVSAGFENVATRATTDELIITYENRLYRHHLRGLQRVIQYAMPRASGAERLTLLPRNNDIPLVAITIPVDVQAAYIRGDVSDTAYAAAIDVTVDLRDHGREMASAIRRNVSRMKLDFSVHPALAFQFGNFSDPIESQFSLVPEVQTQLWPGGSLRAQLILPIQNELSEEGDFVRPGLLALNHTARLPKNVFVGATIGYFTENRYGIDAGARVFMMNGRLMAGGNVGYTGYLSYRDRQWYYDEISIWTPSATAGYRLMPRYDLTVQATYGKFLYQDMGLRVDVTRRFGEVQLTLFGIMGEGSDNVGFVVSLPFFGSRYMRPGRVRIRPPRAIGYAYRFKNIPLDGISFETGYDLDQVDLGLNPDYIRNELPRLSGWQSE